MLSNETKIQTSGLPEVRVFDNSKTTNIIAKALIFDTVLLLGLLILLTVHYASAYDSEGGLNESEMYSVMFNPDYAYDSSMNNPSWYQPIKDYLYKFNAYFKDNAPSVETTILVKKMVWNTNNAQYEDTTNVWQSTHWYFFSNNGTEVPQSNLDPVKEYFKNNTEDIDEFVSVDGDHPDILNVTIDIDSEGIILDRSAQGYVTMTENDLSDMKSTIGGQDYGFSLEGMGGEGGIGEIYSSVGTGGERSNGMSNVFKYLFYALIPILFILSIINMLGKVL